VSVSVAKIHSSPDKSSSLLRKVKKFYPLLILEKSRNWLKISDYEGGEGWIHRSLVSNIQTVITKTTDCNIRSAPAIFHKKLATIGKGVTFKVIKEEEEWLKIEHSGGFIGWIHKSLVW
jgi:SH3-like domain-containing protein